MAKKPGIQHVKRQLIGSRKHSGERPVKKALEWWETKIFNAEVTSQTIWLRVRHIATDGQSVCLSWCRAPSGAHDQIFVYCFVHGRAPSLTRGWVCLVSESVNSHSQLSVIYIYLQI
jgi:hypothetical protein